MGLFNFIKDVGEKLWDAVTGSHDTADLTKEVWEHLSKTDAPDAGEADVQVSEGEATVSGEGLSQEAKEKILVTTGSTSSIASIDDQVKTSAPASENQLYTVKPGDTLGAIAEQVYGNTDLYNQIFEANKPMPRSLGKIYPGQVLRIPEQ